MEIVEKIMEQTNLKRFESEREIQEVINKTGNARLDVIALMNLGVRSEAAKRVIKKRNMRKKLIEQGITFEESCLVVDKQFIK